VKIKKINEEKKADGLKVKTNVKAGPADQIALCG